MARDDHSGRNLALAAGGGALLWWLLRQGRGWAGAGRAVSPPVPAVQPVRIRVDQAGISIEGRPVSVVEAVAEARSVGAAIVMPTGAARQGTLDVLLTALRDAGLPVWTRDPAAAAIAGGRHGA
ncbi:MAG: hypothetical protein H6709_10590 [Kofleriaceae bacterium]|nr:hypothetical protein [Myxococcales bacterium]MCB9564110.1 hypothetical protein [Kofleriaceae bacterium]MCB9572522.1 hypothetical protein [Kofleriaceae bacterium]